MSPATIHHEIKIRRVGNDAVPLQPMPTMHPGETVRYSSDDGNVTVKFPGASPFAQTVIGAGQIVTVQDVVGHFLCQCFITLQDGRTVGWVADPSPSGADHNVTPP